MKLRQNGTVSFLIKLAASAAIGVADPPMAEHPTPETLSPIHYAILPSH